jgi:MYXO-CTERM domain-containing protein
VLLTLFTASLAIAQEPYDSLVPGEWTVVSMNTVRDMDPCPDRDCSYSAVEGLSGAINDWCGGAFASGFGALGGLVIWGGGHNGYFGSEVYVFDLAERRWQRVSEPYDDGSGSVAGACNADGVYPDGSACPTHTDDQVEYDPMTNSFVVIGGTPDPVCGGCVDDRVHFFDFDTRSWSLGARKPNPLWYAGTTAYDAMRDVFWLLPAQTSAFSRYDPRADRWEEIGERLVFSNDGSGAIDPDRDLYVFVDGRGSGEVYGIPLDAPDSGLIPLTTSGDVEIQSRGATGFEWDPIGRRLVAWHDGADVYVLNGPEGDWRSGTWTWTRVSPAPTNTEIPSRNPNGTYSRFRYAASVNAFVLVSDWDGPVWAYRLSPGEGTGPNPDAGPAPDGGTAGRSDGGATRSDGGSVRRDGGAIPPPAGDGCGCAASPSGGGALVSMLVACLILRRRSRKQPRAIGASPVSVRVGPRTPGLPDSRTGSGSLGG